MEQVKRRLRHGFEVTARDISILCYLAKHRFVAGPELRSRFWRGTITKSFYTRLRKLVTHGLLETVQGDGQTVLAYQIGRKGIPYLPDEALRVRALGIRKTSYRTGFDHDRLLQKVQDILETSPLISDFRGEHEVRTLLGFRHGKREKRDQGYKVPDALFRLTTPIASLLVAIELELTAKSEIRYRRIFRELLTSTDFEAVFYIVRSGKLRELLVRILRAVRTEDLVLSTSDRPNGIYFGILSEVLENGLAATFQGEDRAFSLESLAGAS